VASIGRLRLSGLIGWLAWLFVHLTFLTGFKNRLATLPRWAFTFIGNGRPQRTITMQQVIARVAIDEAGGRPYLLSLTSDEKRPDSAEPEEEG
jgi:NADH dehydrogenase